MKELIKLGEKTYCLKNKVNIGIYKLDNNEVVVIDTGNSKDYGKSIDKILQEKNWKLKYIINTHSHSDHIGGNNYLQNKYGCEILSNKIESYFINEPILEPALFFGTNPEIEIFKTFGCKYKSECQNIENKKIEGIKIINLEGHSFGQIGVVTSDSVVFCGDAYTSKEIIEKYAIQYIYDIEKHLKTLNFLKTSNYKFYVPSHGDIEKKPFNTIEKNIRNINTIEENILEIINNKISYNNLIKKIFDNYHIKMNITQYYLISSTIKSFLTKLEIENKINFLFEDNEMYINYLK